MAIARDTTAKNIQPLEGSIITRFTAGATISAGELVSIMADGFVDPTDTSALTGANVAGVALQAVVSGDEVDVVTFGPVNCLTGATVGAIVYGTDTAGEPGEAAGTKSTIAGYNVSATVLFVRVERVALA